MKELGVHYLDTRGSFGVRYASFSTFEGAPTVRLIAKDILDDGRRVVVEVPPGTKDPRLAKYAGETIALFNIWKRL